ncbi:polysaccharide biosynthesis tyrosine autokinase [Cryobacterium sp. 1639]|uniref:polysaccharide biosynthesis tyrosine autokinase n=1 Tax=Cryobacterium inferilacus TaxID=2866629 RepID=UPI001C72A514|nr:polysaccharide biosynthesis tyrosine autokinase [Cryobacterium sp. 1639]MBX0301323.1 polysaccharide biosynthesis tyrosine autokinase [Cryobacterium sp. 1639]
MTVLDFLRLTRKNWIILIAGIVLGAIVMFGYTQVQPRVYAASSAGYVVAGGEPGLIDALSGAEVASNKARSFIPLITSRAVFEEIAADPDLDLGGQSLDGRLSAFVAEGSALLQVSATASTPEAAAALANGALDAVATVVGRLAAGLGGQTSSIAVVPLENAVAPTAPVSPDLRTNVLLGAIAGLAVAYLLIFLRRAADVRIRTASDLSKAAGGAGELGRIPKSSQLAGADRKLADADARAAEAFRRLRTNLRFSSVDEQVHSVVVTSANAGEGKSTVAVMLAKVLAHSGQPTVLIDADLRRPSVSGLTGVDGSIGLSEVLSGQVQIDDALRTTDTPGLLVLPAGHVPPNPSEMLGSHAMSSVLAGLSEHYFVVIDAPPVLPVTDAALLSVAADGTILLATVGKTRKEDMALARHTLDQVHARILGTVLNKVSGRETGEGYEYQRNAKYYAKGPESVPAAAAVPAPATRADGETSFDGARLRRAARRGD